MSSMTSFEDLPTEVIESICLYLRISCAEHFESESVFAARLGLASLCRASKALHRIAVPHLYDYVRITNHDTNLVSLTRSVFQNRYLASLIAILRLNLSCSFSSDPLLDENLTFHSPTHLIKETVHGHGYGTIIPTEWRYDIRLLGLLLSRIHNLNSLEVVVDPEGFDIECWEFIRNTYRNDSDFLSQLKKVTFHNRAPLLPTSIDLVISLVIHGTRIEKLSMTHGFFFRGVSHWSLSSLLQLSILGLELSQDGLVNLIECCPKLEHFEYEWDGMQDIGELPRTTSTALFLPEIVGFALKPLRSSLHTLMLRLCWEKEDNVEACVSITDFSRLRNVNIGFNQVPWTYYERCDALPLLSNRIPFLDGLPSSVENLYISGVAKTFKNNLQPWMERVSNNLRSWMAGMSNELPRLKSLIVDGHINPETCFAKAGIHYQEVDCTQPAVNASHFEETWKEHLAAAGHKLWTPV